MTFDLVREWLGGGLVVVGAAFTVIAALGLNRMPDVFTRMHAVAVGDTIGIGLVLLGLMVIAGLSLIAVKLIFLFLFLALTNPVAAHAIARAALHAGVQPVVTGDGESGGSAGEQSQSTR